MIDRVPPQNIEAEQAVLGAMLLEREAIAKVIKTAMGLLGIEVPERM